jgi:hypothetical protein
MGPHSPPHAAGNTGFRSEEIVSPSSFLSVSRDAQQTRPGTVGSSGPWKAGRFEGLTDDLLEQGVQLCGLDRLLQHRCVGKRGYNAVGPVASDESKWDFSIRENIGDGIGFFAAQSRMPACRLPVLAASMAGGRRPCVRRRRAYPRASSRRAVRLRQAERVYRRYQNRLALPARAAVAETGTALEKCRITLKGLQKLPP